MLHLNGGDGHHHWKILGGRQGRPKRRGSGSPPPPLYPPLDGGMRRNFWWRARTFIRSHHWQSIHFQFKHVLKLKVCVGSRLPIWGRDGIRGRVSCMVAYNVKAHHRHNYTVETEMPSRLTSQSIAICVLRERLFSRFRGKRWIYGVDYGATTPALFNCMLTAR